MAQTEQVRGDVFKALDRGEAISIISTAYKKYDVVLICDNAGNEIEATVVAVSALFGETHAILAESRVNNQNTNVEQNDG